MTSFEIDVMRQSGSWPEVEDIIKHTISKILRCYEINTTEISIVLADNNFIQDLNLTYRGQNKPTNVLSFPQDGDSHLGDVILAYETIMEEAEDQDKSFEDHLIHLIVHGTLHLLGYDHKTDKEAYEMEAHEIKILNDLGIKNPYETQNFKVQ